MSDSAKTIIKYFCDRFLDLDYYPTNLKSILNLDLEKLRNIDEKDVEKFKKLEITTLRDLAKLSEYGFENLAQKTQIEKSILKNAIIASNLISNAWNKRNQYLKKPKLKIVVTGLDFAGKTSLINRLLNDYNYSDMASIKPTIGANIEEYESEKMDLILWDLGGQKDHIDEYLTSPERFFVQVDIIIFVVDSQDDIRYLEAVKYLNDIIEILDFLNENPFIVVLLNKADFDLREDPDFQIKLEYLSDKVVDLFKKSQNSWNFEVIPTSIYNYYSNQPEIVKNIKNIFSKGKEETDRETTVSDIDEKFQKIIDINLRLMDKFVSELSEIKKTLLRIVPSSISQSLYSIPFKKVHKDYISPEFKKTGKKSRKKKNTKDEKSKKVGKYKKGTGPPKPMSIHPHLKEDHQISKKIEKLTNKKVQEVKTSLKQNSQLQNNISAPPIAPPITPCFGVIGGSIDLKSLHPPSPLPAPPKISSRGNIGSSTPRKEIITELKEMFLKRGLAQRYDL